MAIGLASRTLFIENEPLLEAQPWPQIMLAKWGMNLLNAFMLTEEKGFQVERRSSIYQTSNWPSKV